MDKARDVIKLYNKDTEKDNAVVVHDLEKKFGNFIAVNRINFSVNKGEVFGFIGPNGAGKSTTIRMLCGILSPTYGIGHVGGYDIITEQEFIKQNIGYMSQKFSLYEDLTVEENINFYSGIYRIPANKKEERKEWVLKLAELKDLRSTRAGILAGGWKQRLALGCAIIHEPNILFLDEPTSGVDPISRKNFWRIIKNLAEAGVTVFVTTHYMDEAENCNRIALIYKGNIIAMGTPLDLKTKFMKKDVLEIDLPNSEEWIDKIADVNTIKEIALFGTIIHAVVDSDAISMPIIKDFFAKENIKNYSMQKIEPSLEDVFVSLIETYDKNDVQVQNLNIIKEDNELSAG